MCLMLPETFNLPLSSSQERNPTWGRPAKRSRPRGSRSPSCSSRPSGRWRTSSMSLHWSSSSLSGHMLSEKRTGNSTCWHKTSSMRKSTPKTKRHTSNRGSKEKDGFFVPTQMFSLGLKRRRKVRVSVTDYWWVMWLVCVWLSCRTRLPVTQRSDSSVFSHLCQQTGWRARVSSAGGVPRSPPASNPFHFHVKGHPSRGAAAGTWSGGTLSALSWSDVDYVWLHHSDPDEHFHWLCCV